MKIAILGSGNGAHAVAFDCAKTGHDVFMFDFPQFGRSVSDISAAGGIHAEGRMEGFEKIAYAGSDIGKVISDAKMIFAVGPSYSTEPFGKACTPYVKEGQIYVVMPGSCMGALAFKRALGLDVSDNRVTVSETSTLPYAVRIVGPARIDVYHRLPAAYMMATLPRENNDIVFEMLSKIFAGIEKGVSVLQTTLQNSNPIIHPTVTTLNAALIERTQGNFEFYSEGITPAVANLMEAIDMERMKIGEAFGLFIERSLEKGIRQGYFETGVTDYYIAYSKSAAFAGIKAQHGLDHRYYNEDVGYTMVFFIELADRIGVPVPVMKSMLTVVSTIMQRDYVAKAPRILRKLGLGSYSVDELKKL